MIRQNSVDHVGTGEKYQATVAWWYSHGLLWPRGERKLATIASELMATGGAAPEPSELAPILGRKVWARRDALPAVTRKLLVKVVEQTEARLQASVSERNTKRS